MKSIQKWYWIAGAVLVLTLTSELSAAEPFRYPEGKHGKGELRYQDGIAIVTVEGSPAEIGEQMGVLVLKPAIGLLKQADGLLAAHGLQQIFPLLLKSGNGMTRQFPPDHLAEIESAAGHSGWPRDMLIFANTVGDLKKLTSCSVLIVSAEKSTTGSPLFGRNLDTPPVLSLHEYTFVAVFRPTGKKAFAMIGYPGTFGCYSGLNEMGLALADLTVNSVADGSSKLDPGGVPYTLAMRRALEECGTVDQTEKLIGSLRRTTMQNLAVCDRQGGAILEITTKQVIRRRPEEGICACTNHFRTEALTNEGVPQACKRFSQLEKSQGQDKVSIPDVIKQLDAVHQGAWTMQSMVFEPAQLKLHLSIGAGPASSLPFHPIELEPLFVGRWTKK